MLAYTWPLLSLFWTFLMFAGVVLLLFFIIWCFVDNFRRRDHSGWAKAGWTVLILIFPFFGRADLHHRPPGGRAPRLSAEGAAPGGGAPGIQPDRVSRPSGPWTTPGIEKRPDSSAGTSSRATTVVSTQTDGALDQHRLLVGKEGEAELGRAPARHDAGDEG